MNDVRVLFERPASPDEETIAQRLKAANLYRLRPAWFRLIDNARWFGYKQEFELLRNAYGDNLAVASNPLAAVI